MTKPARGNNAEVASVRDAEEVELAEME